MYIYKITNKNTGKCYIGQTVDYRKRFAEHRRTVGDLTCNTKFCKALRAEGLENFSFDVLFECNYYDANLMERFLISSLNTVENGYNTVLGDFDKAKATKVYEQIKTGNYIVGEPTGFVEGKAVICLDSDELFVSATECEAFYGVDHVSDVCRGKRASTHGKHFRFWSETDGIIEVESEVKEKAVQIYCVELNTIYDSIMSAIHALGLQENAKGAISKAMKGKLESAYGYHWREVINDEIQESKFVSKRAPARQILMDDCILYNSVAEAIEDLGLNKRARGSIGACANGKQVQAYGHTWKYVIDGGIKNIQASYSNIDRSKVRQFEIICDDELTFRSLRKATDYFGLKPSCNVKIAACCRGELESAYGHTWKYGKEVTKLGKEPTVEETL